MCLKTTFDSTTNHLNLPSMFLNCLLLDVTVIDLMSIVHMDKIWVEIAKKNLKCGRPGGGGSSVISDVPPDEGEGGSKKGKFLRTSFMDGPFTNGPSIFLLTDQRRVAWPTARGAALCTLFVVKPVYPGAQNSDGRLTHPV